MLKDILNQEFKEKYKTEDKEIYLKALREEWKVIEETNMSDYFLLNYHIIKEGRTWWKNSVDIERFITISIFVIYLDSLP